VEIQVPEKSKCDHLKGDSSVVRNGGSHIGSILNNDTSIQPILPFTSHMKKCIAWRCTLHNFVSHFIVLESRRCTFFFSMFPPYHPEKTYSIFLSHSCTLCFKHSPNFSEFYSSPD